MGRSSNYQSMFKKNQINPNMLLYKFCSIESEVFNFFEHCTQNEHFLAYTHILTVDSIAVRREIEKRYGQHHNVKIIDSSDRLFLDCLSRAKYLLNDDVFPGFFTKKHEQIYINWMFAYLVEDELGDVVAKARYAKELFAIDYLVYPEQWIYEKMDQIFKLQELFTFTPVVANCDAQQVFTQVFNNQQVDEKKNKGTKTKQSILITRGDMTGNGITHSLLALLNNINYEQYDVTVYVYQSEDAAVLSLIDAINPKARVVVRESKWNATRAEVALKNIILSSGVRPLQKMYHYLADIFAREYQRYFGQTQFDVVIEFGGYSSFLAMLVLQSAGKKKIIWQHNDIKADMYREVNGKKPFKIPLQVVSALYKEFDAVVSCSKSVMEVNKVNFSDVVPVEKFKYTRNCINLKRIEKSNGATEGENQEIMVKLPQDSEISFVSMGRLSPPKNYKNLILAFDKLAKKHKNATLYILGEGPLREELEETVQRLQLCERVFMPGNLEQPFGFIKKCKCFILPSLYEGQPMVILEARSMGLPIIMTNFSTAADSMIEAGQYVINAEVDSICSGMEAFINNEVPQYHFNPYEYNTEAQVEFEAAIR